MRMSLPLQARGSTPIVAVALIAAALVTPARAAPTVAVRLVAPFPPERYAGHGAVGLIVPGDGPRVSRAGAVASLLRGKVEPWALGGVPSGKPIVRLAHRPGRVTIYVALPPRGAHPN